MWAICIDFWQDWWKMRWIVFAMLFFFSAKMFDEKGHRSMTLSFYLTGKDRSGVVAVKVQKVSSYSLSLLKNIFHLSRISAINSCMITFSFNSIDLGTIKISFKSIRILLNYSRRLSSLLFLMYISLECEYFSSFPWIFIFFIIFIQNMAVQ